MSKCRSAVSFFLRQPRLVFWPLLLALWTFPLIAGAQPVIQEVLYDGPGTDGDDVFTEILGSPGLVLDGWQLVGVNGGSGAVYRRVELTGAIIPPDGILVVATAAAAGTVLAQRDLVGEVDWQNGPDAVQLRDSTDAVVDALQYGDAGLFNAGEGAFAGLVLSGQSLSRDASGSDSGDNEADFSALDQPTPGSAGSAPPLLPTISLPDTAVEYGTSFQIPIHLRDLEPTDLVAAEVFILYDGDLARAVSVNPGPLLAPTWALETNIAEGLGSTIDTLKIAMASPGDSLGGSLELGNIDFVAADRRAPSLSSLGFERALLNDGVPGLDVVAGSVILIGNDGTIEVTLSQLTPPSPLEVSVWDPDENRDDTAMDTLFVQVDNGGQTERIIALETGVSTSVFTGAIATLASSVTPSDDGVVQVAAGDSVALCYDDSLDGSGAAVQRCTAISVVGSNGSDGQLRATAVVQPGDTLRVRVVDADLNSDSLVVETALVQVLNDASGEVESVVLTEVSGDDSVFWGQLPSVIGTAVNDDGNLSLVKGQVLTLTYDDSLTASGGSVQRTVATTVVDPFGDADGSGQTLAFDAGLILAHVLVPSLSGLDSLAANVDLAAPFGPITPLDASLVLQQRVGLIGRFPVQEQAAANHPSLGLDSTPKPLIETKRSLALRQEKGAVIVWAEDRTGIVAGQLEVEGATGPIEMGPGLGHFLKAWHPTATGVRLVFAGSRATAGPGPLLRLEGSSTSPRLSQVVLNDGAIQIEASSSPLAAPRPTDFVLYPNFPNPFNPSTTLSFFLPEAAHVQLQVFDVAGQRVRTIIADRLPSGAHRVVWDGRNTAGDLAGSGVYFARLEAGGQRQIGRMTLLK